MLSTHVVLLLAGSAGVSRMPPVGPGMPTIQLPSVLFGSPFFDGSMMSVTRRGLMSRNLSVTVPSPTAPHGPGSLYVQWSTSSPVTEVRRWVHGRPCEDACD